MHKIIAIIPARYSSSRFPGKPLANICGKPMIQWVYERVTSVNEIDAVYVATDDARIFKIVEDFSGRAVMTGECSCGTERVYQACKDIEADIVLNVQGDEPLISPEMIRILVGAFNDSTVQMATLKKKIANAEELNNPNVVKVITDMCEDAIYFSRFAIPYDRDKKGEINRYKHIGIYGYKKSFLEKYIALPRTDLEKAENLEQLRAIESGYKIRVKETIYQSIGVDQPSDIALVEEQMKREGIC
ncbi:MAG: 3-deoxy-manno-octulosonate cytidylyltransferase [Lachnospiraceae bacterium]|nr:3-deoxy-manno-octulosonate cytidylyltransferase [Muribaculaceae bacterium]MCM1409730.1 3-deoxy-manno-octulosonate cytidylyltransferase [Lachnospiraceae bacterium]